MTGIGRKTVSLVVLTALSGCAGLETVIAPPEVTLTDVRVTEVGADKQTFVLGFGVSNPNPFPLPVRSIRYRIRLGEQQFAGGETSASFTVPAEGSSEFAISTELDLLKTTSYVSMLIRSGLRRDMDYALSGSLIVAVPGAKPLEFSKTGTIELTAAGF